MLIVEDEVVLCLFEGSATAVRSVAERAAIPFGRSPPGHRRALVEGAFESRRLTGEKEVLMKRIGVIALAAGLVLALGACSSSSSDSGSTSSTSAPPTSTAPAATSAAADTGDLSGTWSGQYDGTFQGTFVLDWQQSGSNLSGTIEAVLRLWNGRCLHGTVNGGTISFGTVGSQAITYSGSVSGDSMSGTYKVQTPNGSVGGSWSATKGS